MTDRVELLTNRAAIDTTELRASDPGPLSPGWIRVEVERYALTANNISYAQFGDLLDYWSFFPVDAVWGRVPAMGWGRIVESTVGGLDVGGRYYGWFPMASSVDLVATPTSTGFRDDGAHRAAHAPAYRSFLRTDLDGLYTDRAHEDRHALLRGLFLTGFLIDAYFAASGYLGAEQAVVLSASSKTALAYAHCARAAGQVQLVGVTSDRNRPFVADVGAYDRIVTYDELDGIELRPAVVIDMAGNGAAVAEIHARLADRITHSMIVGKSHHDAPPAAVSAGPAPELFFAPTAMHERAVEWGVDEYQRRTRSGLASFIADSERWLHIAEHLGPERAKAAWSTLFAAGFPPSTGVIASLNA